MSRAPAAPVRSSSTSPRTSSSPRATTPASPIRSTRATTRKTEGDERAVAAAVELMANAKRPLFYTGGGIINSGPLASQRLRELVRMTGFPITSTLMGLGAYPGLRQAVARHARHAWHLRSQQRHARLRRDDLHRRALRRPHHRPGRRLLARLEEDPCRYRPLLDQQERQGRSPHRRRLRARAGADDRRLEGQEAEARQGRAQILVGRDRPLARAQLPAATASATT